MSTQPLSKPAAQSLVQPAAQPSVHPEVSASPGSASAGGLGRPSQQLLASVVKWAELIQPPRVSSGGSGDMLQPSFPAGSEGSLQLSSVLIGWSKDSLQQSGGPALSGPAWPRLACLPNQVQACTEGLHTPMSLPATSLLSFLTQAYTGSGYVVSLGVDLLNQGILDAWLAKLQVNPLNTDYGLLCCWTPGRPPELLSYKLCDLDLNPNADIDALNRKLIK